MDPYSRSSDAWERVLTAIEADAAKAASLIVDDSSAQAGIEYDVAHGEGGFGPDGPVDVPADWRLPTNSDQPKSELPDSSEMPPIPPELVDRIKALRTRITALQSDLSDAMAEARQAMRPPAATAAAVERPPSLIDRAL